MGAMLSGEAKPASCDRRFHNGHRTGGRGACCESNQKHSNSQPASLPKGCLESVEWSGGMESVEWNTGMAFDLPRINNTQLSEIGGLGNTGLGIVEWNTLCDLCTPKLAK